MSHYCGYSDSHEQTYNLDKLEQGVIFETGQTENNVSTSRGSVLVKRIKGVCYFIPKKWESKFNDSSYFISYGLKKRGDITMYDLHFFSSYKDAKKFKESRIVLTELLELKKYKVHKVSEYKTKKLKFGYTLLAVIDEHAYILPSRFVDQLDEIQDKKYLVYKGKSKHTNFEGKKYEKHNLSFFATKTEAKASLE